MLNLCRENLTYSFIQIVEGENKTQGFQLISQKEVLLK